MNHISSTHGEIQRVGEEGKRERSHLTAERGKVGGWEGGRDGGRESREIQDSGRQKTRGMQSRARVMRERE